MNRNTKRQEKKYFESLNIIKYFTFDNNHSVALRSGDCLMFNPTINHCISTKTEAYLTKDVYCVSHYFKSNLIGMNDNNIIFQ